MGRILFVILACMPAAADAAELWWPDPVYPAPQREAAPAWLLRNKVNFSRWDGGRIEVCKGFLSGWAYFNPPWPDVVHATARWYEPKTVELAHAAGYDFIWLTFSTGFSIEMEQGQWDQLRGYVAECHRHGIKVAAYMSATNLFVDDMFTRVPESKDWLLRTASGETYPYGAANYGKIGRTTRMLADLSHPGWRAYQKRRVDAAIDLGFDAIEYDNVFYHTDGARGQERYQSFLHRNGFTDTLAARGQYRREQMRAFFREMLSHARQRKPDMVIFCNVNRHDYTVARACTMVTTEDGKEPGYYRDTPDGSVGNESNKPLYVDLPDDGKRMAFTAGDLRTNLGLLRGLRGIHGGWKPVMVEYGGRRNGDRFLNQMPPLAFQLAIGECNAALCSLQGFQEGRALLDLYQRKPEAMAIVAAARRAHDFTRKHQAHVVDAEYRANVALVVDDRMPDRALRDLLVKRNVQFEVLFDDRVRMEELKRFQRVLAFDARLLSDESVQALVEFTRGGGHVALVGDCGIMDLWGQPRKQNPLGRDGPWTRIQARADLEACAVFLTEDVQPSFAVLDNPLVMFTLTERAGQKGFVAHLLNYQKHTLEEVRIRIVASRGKPVLHALTSGCEAIKPGKAAHEWIIPKLGVYSLLVWTEEDQQHHGSPAGANEDSVD